MGSGAPKMRPNTDLWVSFNDVLFILTRQPYQQVLILQSTCEHVHK